MIILVFTSCYFLLCSPLVAVDLNAYALRHNLSEKEKKQLYKLDDDLDGNLSMDEVLHGAMRLQKSQKTVVSFFLLCFVFMVSCEY